MKKVFALMILCCFISIGTRSYSQQISGYKWEEVTNIPVPYNNIYWLDVFFLKDNPNFGWVSGYGGNVLRTTDGGLSWSGMKIQKMKIDSIYNGTGYDYDTTFVPLVNQLESLSFVNENDGYVSGDGQVFKTTDGGRSWNSLQMFYGIWGVNFIDTNTGIAVGGGCQENQNFYRTSDAGVTWNKFSDSVPNTGLSDAFLLSAEGLGYASSSGYIWITTNGGISWDVLCSTGNRDWQEDIAVFGKTILVPYSLNCMGGGDQGGLRITTDLGETWKDFSINTSMYGTFLLDSFKGWGVGLENSIYYTNDAGVNWYLLNSGIYDNYPADDIWFINDTTGWLVGRGVYKFTGNIVVDVVEEKEYRKLIQNVSPNPVENILSISINTDKQNDINITFYSLTGNIIFKETLLAEKSRQNEIRLDINGISSGIYILHVRQGTDSEYQKIVKY